MQNVTAYRLAKATEEIVSIADACLGGLRGRSALLVGPAKERQPFAHLLQQAEMKYLYEEDNPLRLSSILPHVQLLISVPAPEAPVPLLKAASIASGCIGRRAPLLIFDLSEVAPSVEDLAGLLPPVCLYTPEDLRRIFSGYF
jgi:glutamyl-tRNA reductase